MAKYQVIYQCGCEKTVNLTGKYKDRERKLAWMETIPCWDCENAAKAEQYEKENAAAAEANKEMQLPELSGSPKQIAWAESIRAKMIADLPSFEEEEEDLDEVSRLLVDGFIPWFKGQDRAAWWIDHRNKTYDQAVSSGDVMGCLNAVFAGHAGEASWKNFFRQWMSDNHPEVIDRIQQEQARKRAEKEKNNKKGAKKLAAEVSQAAEDVKEEDCKFDDYGNWKGATVNGREYKNTFCVYEINEIDGQHIGNPFALADKYPELTKALEKLSSAVQKITESRKARLKAEADAKYSESVATGHVVRVERSRKRTDNTVAYLSTGAIIIAQVNRIGDDWGRCFAESNSNKPSDPANFRRIGIEAKSLHQSSK